MKKLLLISMLIGALPLSMAAQDDDLYFVPKKKSVEKVTDNYGLPRDAYYSGSDRSIDDYNRRGSYYEPVEGDSTQLDIIEFSSETGVYPDSIGSDDFELTKQMSRFDDYDISDNAAFWAGYNAGRSDWGWHSPWYYSRFGWYGGWYDPWYSPWYYGSWRYGGWYDPWYYGYAGWYGWYDPWYYGYHGYYGWGYPHYYGWYGSGGGRHYASTIGAGSIRRDGVSHGGYGRGTIAGSSSRMGALRNRSVGSHTRYNRTSASRNSSYSSSRNSSNNSSFSGARNTGSFSSGSSSHSSGGFSGGASRGGGGGSRMGGRR